jgi:poly(A) polymerase
MLRAIRFASRLGFKIDRKSSKAIKDYAAEIQHASMARLVEEVIKLFSFSSGEAAMRMMHKTGLMKYILPYLHDSLKKMDKSDFEKYFSYLHYLDKTYSGEKSIPPALIFSALIMPLGKNAMKKCEGRYIPADVIRNVTKEFCKDFIIPRRMRDAIRQTLLAVERIDAKTKRRGNRNRFMTKDYFPSALMLYSFMVDIEGVDTYKLEKWQESYTEFLSHSNHKKNDSGKHGETENNKNHSSSSSRKRKKKSKKKKTGINNSSSTQTESIEASTTIEKNVSEKRDETSIKKEKSTKDTDKKTASSISARKKTGKKKTQRKPQNPEIEKTEDAKTKSLKANKKQKSKSKASEKSKDANNEKKNPQEKSASNESGRRRHKRKIRSNINMVNDNRKSVLMSDGNTIHEESQPHWLDEI